MEWPGRGVVPHFLRVQMVGVLKGHEIQRVLYILAFTPGTDGNSDSGGAVAILQSQGQGEKGEGECVREWWS
jgi:hypothetical protein